MYFCALQAAGGRKLPRLQHGGANVHHHLVFLRVKAFGHIPGEEHIVCAQHLFPIDINVRKGVDPLKTQVLRRVCYGDRGEIPQVHILVPLDLPGLYGIIKILHFSGFHQVYLEISRHRGGQNIKARVFQLPNGGKDLSQALFMRGISQLPVHAILLPGARPPFFCFLRCGVAQCSPILLKKHRLVNTGARPFL